ncbi:DNA polymerase alpha/epsilon subunit B family protein [Babesia bovis T2Bo]|uniref:DNA polymerase alpha/epsilon subunit B family protein n=1 Tax=Babesia bovis T2Bo TaxID=484906 RepID=UPI001C35B159|nr:DNA polymerase alpha/epsilon subunit B family protein [Babesia bovis T2Bo]EDO08043.2 DNA polymerase alpha/epsilon subunit B family protein [Babesia bovis T2Bo]
MATREIAVYDDSLSQRFRIIGVPYSNQYYTYSMEKLERLRPCFFPLIESRWRDTIIDTTDSVPKPGRYVYVPSIKDAKGDCVIIGTLYKDMKLRPSPLEEYSEELKLRQPMKAKYTSPDDRLFIEDQSIRVAIRGSILDPQRLVTGLVICLKGRINDQGEFECEDYMHPGPPLMCLEPRSEEKYVAFVSGLDLGGQTTSRSALLLLRDFIFGSTPLSELSRKVVRLVIAGNGIGKCDVSALSQCDVYFAQLAGSIPVDLMPGNDDPSNRNIPQQPIHPTFLEHSSRYSSFQSTTNPYAFSVDGIRFLGTSSQAVRGICEYSHLNELEALRLTASARFIAPTAPDTLGCHPEAAVLHLTEDNEFPHVMFSGNSHEYATSTMDGLPRLICVPAFSKQPCVILVSLSTLEPRLIRFE